jgi:hypothetical protein
MISTKKVTYKTVVFFGLPEPKNPTHLNMAIQCTECKLYKPNHEVRNGVCEDCYESSDFSSSDDEDQIENSSSEDEAVSIVSLTKPNKLSSKTCSKCKITKELELFYKNKRKKDGRHSTFNECRKTPNEMCCFGSRFNSTIIVLNKIKLTN